MSEYHPGEAVRRISCSFYYRPQYALTHALTSFLFIKFFTKLRQILTSTGSGELRSRNPETSAARHLQGSSVSREVYIPNG